MRNAMRGAMVRAGTTIMEPMQKMFVSVPNDWLGGVTREVTQRRGVIEDMPADGETTTVVGDSVARALDSRMTFVQHHKDVQSGTARTQDLRNCLARCWKPSLVISALERA